MTQDGRPSLINDIRLFVGDRKSYLEGHADEVAFGRRMAWMLNAEGLSVGSNTAHYVRFTPSLPPGQVEPCEPSRFRDDWWFREVKVGVSLDFPSGNDQDLIARGIVDSLKVLVPDQADLIEDAAAIVRTQGEGLRFLLKSRETSKCRIETTATIGAWPQPSHLHVSLTEKSSGAYLEAPAALVKFYDDVLRVAVKVKITGLAGKAQASETAPSMRDADAPHWTLADFVPAERPFVSKVLKLR